ncbi:DUF2406 domain-containing protein [Aspergillus affinis]|uniref:DUF2406 domain-containing protein n=1 Tax=Aspergillus affinis TaxID=1070780 RepID=UPI0022FE2D3B|nr:uncharacterized protein KD926_006429 [Aspergillus affinis]KAI9041883.1 hypothetical protein KD926_006429 [Aspergillus affinis]
MPSSRASSDRTGSIGSHEAYKKSSLSSKADPNQALNEAQPMANVGASDLFSLRSMQHRDAEGKIITEPDLTNPTRPRFERPLDTIKNFEAAIDRRRKENAMA